MKSKALLIALCAACLFPAISHANQDSQDGHRKGPSSKKMFKKLDTNQDKSISIAEAEAGDAKRLLQHFETIDTDGDGEITKQEFRKHRKTIEKKKSAKRGKQLKKLDADESGTLSRQEAENGDAKGLLNHFDQIDSDGDGELSKEELKAAGNKRRDRKKENDGDHQDHNHDDE